MIWEHETPWNCTVCGSPFLPPVRETIQHYCGIDVTLDGVEVFHCSACDEYEYQIPFINVLHRDLAEFIVKKAGRLAPTEIKFLRKYLGWSGVDLARRMKVAPETVSRWESGARNMSEMAENFLRVLALREKPIEDYALLERLGTSPAVPERIRASAIDGAWDIQAA